MAKRHSSGGGGALIPAVGYIRMSTDKQEDSPEQQRAEILKLASRLGYHIVRWYEDHAISGAKTHKRKRFRQMIRDAEEIGDFQAILCWDQDRFGRFDSIEAGEWISPLRRAGVELETVTQGRINWEDFAGRMIYQITQEGKHHYLVDLSRNALRGMIRFAKQGNLLGMPTPYGYDRLYHDANGKEMCRIRRGEKFRKPRDWTATLVPSAEKAEVETIRWMFKTFAETDRSARSLAVELNKRGVPSPNGREWDFTHIKNILRNEVYVGCLAYGRRAAGLYHQVGDDGELVAARST
ncbi:MAG: recombinase family protein, partial [Pirellulaceae bacterium]